MNELRTDFKDEILQDGEEHRVYNIKRKGTDEVVESEVYLEKAYEPLQEGTEFGAKDVNEIHGRLNGLAPINKLVNGDFQINQRGQSEYNAKANEYTLDVWASVGVSKIRINPNKKVGGIYTNGSILQFVNENLDNQNVTLSMKIDGIVITKTFKCTVGYSDILVYQGSKFKVSVSNNVLVDRGLTKFEFYLLNLQGEVLIEYIDLFPGDIAYPHVKEDYMIALMRCKQYLKIYKYGAWSYINAAHVTSSVLSADFSDGIEMTNDTPLISSHNTNNTSNFLMSITGKKIIDVTLLGKADKSTQVLGFKLEDDVTPLNDNGSSIAVGSSGATIIISCEPL